MLYSCTFPRRQEDEKHGYAGGCERAAGPLSRPPGGMAGSEALLASQINGGGCLPPPTPSANAQQEMASILHLSGEKLTNFERYSAELPPSLAFRCSTRKQMVEAVGGYIDPANLTVAENPADMGVIMKNGRLTRVSRARRNGDSYFWETSSERANRWHRAPQTLELPDTTEQPDSYE